MSIRSAHRHGFRLALIAALAASPLAEGADDKWSKFTNANAIKGFGPLHWCLGCVSTPQRKAHYTFSVGEPSGTLVIDIRQGADDTGDRGVEVFVYGPPGRTLLRQFKARSERGNDRYRVSFNRPGGYTVTLRDNDTSGSGATPGNGGSITVRVEPGSARNPPRRIPSRTGWRWERVGSGDCGGGDIAFTHTTKPTAPHCGPRTSGLAAICWDGAERRHRDGTVGCTYKKLRPNACRGGGNIGTMYRCVGPNTSASGWRWVPAGTGDCSGNDIGFTTSVTPANAKCNKDSAGRAAVCWDGRSHRNRGGTIGCTYKSLGPSSCSGGNNPGAMYRCSRR